MGTRFLRQSMEPRRRSCPRSLASRSPTTSRKSTSVQTCAVAPSDGAGRSGSSGEPAGTVVHLLDSVLSAVTRTGGLSPSGQTPPSCTHSGGGLVVLPEPRTDPAAGADVLGQLVNGVGALPVGLQRELVDDEPGTAE